jgi:hypothetical protein
MTTEKRQALHEVRPGRLLEDIRFTSGYVVTRGLREGIVPSSSPLARSDTHLFVATNSHPGDPGEIAVALVMHTEGQAELALDARTEGAARNIHYLREVVSEAAELCQVTRIVADPGSLRLEPDVLEHIGFHALESGQVEYTAVA